MNAWFWGGHASAEAWWNWVAAASWQSAAVTMLLLGLVWAGRRWPAPLRYGLLLVALVKFALPPSFSPLPGLVTVAERHMALKTRPDSSSAVSAPGAGNTERPSSPIASRPAPGPSTREIAALASPEPSSEPALSRLLAPWLMLVHALGSATMLCWIASRLARLRRLKKQARPVLEGPLFELYGEVAAVVGVRRLPSLFASDRVPAPMAFGIFRSTIMLPKAVAERLSEPELRTVLAHELAHFRRGDLWVTASQLALLAVWWFHPLFWVLHHALRKVREDCCDDLLLARGLASNEAYCATLVAAARELLPAPTHFAALSFGDHLHPLGHRLKRLMDERQPRHARLSTAGLLMLLSAGALLLPGTRGKPETTPAPPMAENQAALALKRSRETAAEISRRYTEEDTERLNRIGLRRNLATPAPPDIPEDIKALPAAELFHAIDRPSGGSNRQNLLKEEFLGRREEALSFLAVQMALPQASTATRLKAVQWIGSLVARHQSHLTNAVPILAGALHDADSAVAAAAARALLPLGRQAAAAVPPLIVALERGQASAAAVLMQIAPDSEEALGALLRVFADRAKPITLRTAIAQAMFYAPLKPHRDRIEPVLLDAFAEADWRLRRKIGFVLVRLESQSAAAATAIQQAFRNVEKVLVSGEYADAAILELLAYIRDPRTETEAGQALERLSGDVMLVRMKSPQEAAGLLAGVVPVMIDVLKGEQVLAKGPACAVLTNLGPFAEPAFPELLAFLANKGQIERRAAMFALNSICTQAKNPALVPPFAAVLADLAADETEPDALREEARKTLAKLESNAAL